MKKTKEKKKISIKKIVIVLAIILFGVLIFFSYRSLKVKSIYVTGISILKENDLLEQTNLLDYPKLYQVSPSKIESTLIKNDLINSVKVHKSLFGNVTIEVEENKVLYQKTSGKYVLSDNSEIELDYNVLGIPTLINSCEDVCEKLNKKMLLINSDIMKHISDIEYKKSDLDKERFMFYMNDGNYVYVTLSKIDLINSYNEVYPTLEGKKGILYLDSGNHFEIKEKKEEIKEEVQEEKKESTN